MPEQKKSYNHMFTIAFEVVSETDDASDVTANHLRAGLLNRINSLDSTLGVFNRIDGEWIEAVGAPCDTYEVDE